jgi:radical SAM protein with 4Fe4S-binding SPASM domain
MTEFRLLQIEPTTRCNFTCGFCIGRHMAQVDVDYVTVDRAISMFPEIRAVELQGEGEPLLNKRFFEIADRVASQGAHLSMITNGSLLNTERVNQLLARPFERIGISLESSNDQTFEEIRGGHFAKVAAGIRTLKDARDRKGTKLPVIGLNVTVLRQTVTHLVGIIDLYRELGLDGGISFQALQDMPSYVAWYSTPLREELLSQHDKFWVTQAMARVANDRSLDKSGANVGFYARLFSGLAARPKVCPWLTDGGYLSATGEMMPCCHIKNARYSFGNVKNADRETLLERRHAMAQQFENGTAPEPCAGCWVLPFLAGSQIKAPISESANTGPMH